MSLCYDLHSHSIYSDGELTPTALVHAAIEAGIQVFSLTDHDTLNGYPEALAAAKESSLILIPGVEISCRWRHSDIHVIGLRVDPANTLLQAGLERQQQQRIERGRLIGKNLENIGIPHAHVGACSIAGSEIVGRPHFAKFMVQQKIVPDIQTAFKKYLVKGKPGYAPMAWCDMTEAVQWIHAAGGQAVMAHPARYKLTSKRLRLLLQNFKSAGGVAMEIVTANHTPDDVQRMALLSQQCELLASVGSDFHGPTMGRARLGFLSPLPSTCIPIWHDWKL
ncbi:MAG: PHP domain-containing protein [Proteobacteria bacterium]|nr:PHP domain-containing protein [Pseudomonadota bacterium]